MNKCRVLAEPEAQRNPEIHAAAVSACKQLLDADVAALAASNEGFETAVNPANAMRLVAPALWTVSFATVTPDQRKPSAECCHILHIGSPVIYYLHARPKLSRVLRVSMALQSLAEATSLEVSELLLEAAASLAHVTGAQAGGRASAGVGFHAAGTGMLSQVETAAVWPALNPNAATHANPHAVE